jgi:hypothetical protein
MKNDFLIAIKSIYATNKTVQSDTSYTVAVLIVIVLTVLLVGLLLQNEAKIIDKEWEKYRCHPKYVFIGGLIHKEKDIDPIDYTTMNIGHCMSKIAGSSILSANKKMSMIDRFEQARAGTFESGLDKLSSTLSDITTYTAIMTLSMNNMLNNVYALNNSNTQVVKSLFQNIRLYLAQVIVGMDYVRDYSKSMLSMFAHYHKEKEDKYHKSLGNNAIGKFIQSNIWKGEKYTHHKNQKNRVEDLHSKL